jgi:hypothetical protein
MAAIAAVGRAAKAPVDADNLIAHSPAPSLIVYARDTPRGEAFALRRPRRCASLAR